MSQNDPLLANDWFDKEEPISDNKSRFESTTNNNELNEKQLISSNKTKSDLSKDKQFVNSFITSNGMKPLSDNSDRNRLTINDKLMSTITMSSSDSSTDDIVIPMKRRLVRPRFNRKRRSRSSDSSLSVKSRAALVSCPSICLRIVFVVLIVSCLAFTLLFIAKLYDRIDSLQRAINDLSVSGNTVPQEMHTIHSHLKQLNDSSGYLGKELNHTFDIIKNLTQEVNKMKQQMAKISDSVEAAPAIRQLPKELQDLQKAVAEMGSRLTNNDNEVKTFKDIQNAQQLQMNSLQSEVTAIHTNITELYAINEHNNNTIGSAKQFEASIQQNSNQINGLAEKLKNLDTVYTGIENWRTEANEKIKAMFELAQHIHEKLHNTTHSPTLVDKDESPITETNVNHDSNETLSAQTSYPNQTLTGTPQM